MSEPQDSTVENVVAVEQEQDDQGPSKKDLKKAAKEAEKKKKQEEREAKAAAEAAEKAAASAEVAKKFAHIYGKPGTIMSTTVNTKKLTNIKDISTQHVDQTVTIRARVHNIRKQGGKMVFVVLRDTFHSIQALAKTSDSVPAEMVTFIAAVSKESIVDVEAVVCSVPPENAIKSTSQSLFELNVTKFHIVSESAPVLPFQYDDASRNPTTAKADEATVNVDTRINCRWLEMRTKASNAIFRLQSRVGQYFREYLLQKDFVEIHTPKLIGTASEGGANVFKLDYFGKNAYLAQSPQLYKQMALQGDLERVFEVGPVFRAENSNTARHMTEFIGLDMEMRINEHYYEVLDVAEELFAFIFDGLATHTQELAAINEQHPFEPISYRIPHETMVKLGVGNIEKNIASTDEYGGLIRNEDVRMLRIPFAKGISLLNTVLETKASEVEDLSTEHERRLGELVKERYGVDFYIMDRYPATARPFYTMPCPDDARFSNSYDMFIRGQEIVSGAQRIHDPVLLTQRANELGVDITKIKDYVDSFRLGGWPHGGMGVGHERVLFLYLGLSNIRTASMFPRDPQRLTP